MGKITSNIIDDIKDASNFVDNNPDAFDIGFNFFTSYCFDKWPICSSSTRAHYKADDREADG